MKILCTGAAGFICSHLVDRLLAGGFSVRGLDNFDPYYDREIKYRNLSEAMDNPRFELVIGDIRNAQTVREAMRDVDAVIHLAAQAGVRASVEDPEKTISVNVGGTLNVLNAVRYNGIKKMVFASSSSVYGKKVYLPYDEKHPTEPISPYGVSKLAGEHLCRVYSELYGIEIPMMRYFTVMGPRIRPDLAIYKFFQKAMKNETIELYGDGSKTRDFTYINDIVAGTLLALDKGTTQPYNLGGGHQVSVLELANKIIAITGSKSEIKYLDDQAGDALETLANHEKATRELGWTPKVKLDEGLKRYHEWLTKGG